MVAIHEQQQTGTWSVRQGREVVVQIKNDIGILSELSTLVADKGVNILAVSGAVCGEDCVVRLITDDNRKAQEVLREHSYAPREENVVLVELPHRPGTLKEVTTALAKNDIDIHHVYGTTKPEQDKCVLVFHSANDQDALNRLKEIGRE